MKLRTLYTFWWLVDRVTHGLYRVPTFYRTHWDDEKDRLSWRHWKFAPTGIVWTMKPCYRVEELYDRLHDSHHDYRTLNTQ